MPLTWRNRHFLFLDLILLPVCVYLSYVLRLETLVPAARWWPGMLLLALYVEFATPLVFRRAGIYSRFWRYASVDELLLLTGAWTLTVMAATLVSVLSYWLIADEAIVPRSIPLILLMLGLAATAGPRLLLRVVARRLSPLAGDHTQQPVAIMGAGDAGAMIAREMQQNPQLGLRAIAFFDDDPAKHRMVLHGIPVVGDRTLIPHMAQEHGLAQVIIAMPTAPGKQIREVVDLCAAAGVKTRIVPGVYELLDERITINQLRNVEIEDLLRRTAIQTDIAGVRAQLQGRCVLITGGGGSIGGELARQALGCKPGELVLLGHGENSIFEIAQELQAKAGSTAFRTVIADVRFPERLAQVFAMVQPEVVFHTAAHKHVPLMEANPAEAVVNNVLGTEAVLEAAQQTGVDRLVFVSSDKAVNPTNIMGATKRVAEYLVHRAAQQSGRQYAAVRFGNVLGSRGSVLHTFRRQIAAGGPVTVTDPDVRRFFMTIPEAVQLVLQAAVLSRGGEVFVLDMGEPLRIVDLATDLIRLSGLELGRDIDLVFTGLRPGEKLYEELFVEGEVYRRTEHQQIFIAANASAFVPEDLEGGLYGLRRAAQGGDTRAIVAWLRYLVPEYSPFNSASAGVPSAGVENGTGLPATTEIEQSE